MYETFSFKICWLSVIFCSVYLKFLHKSYIFKTVFETNNKCFTFSNRVKLEQIICNFSVSKTQLCLFLFKYKTDFSKPFKFEKLKEKIKSFEYIFWVVIVITKQFVYKDCLRSDKNYNILNKCFLYYSIYRLAKKISQGKQK